MRTAGSRGFTGPGRSVAWPAGPGRMDASTRPARELRAERQADPPFAGGPEVRPGPRVCPESGFCPHLNEFSGAGKTR